MQFLVRPYRPEDESRVLSLLSTALGGGPTGFRSREFFRWKHVENPFGTSLMLVAEAGGEIVGLRAFLRWRFCAGGRTVRAARAVDTATHPAFQGMGVFTRLTREGIESLRGQSELVFNTPNEKSLPGYLKLGWQPVGRVPVSVRVRRPVRFARGLLLEGIADRSAEPASCEDAPSAADALAEAGDLPPLPDAVTEGGHQLSTRRTLKYLRWRYGSAPLLDYKAVREGPAGSPSGLAIFRVRPRGRLWEATVVEVLVPPDDRRMARRLLGRIAAATRVDHLTCSFPSGSAAAGALRRSGFLRSPRGITLVARALTKGLVPDPQHPGSWALSLGDLEVF